MLSNKSMLSTILTILIAAYYLFLCSAEGVSYTPAPHKLNILFLTFDARGHFDSYTGLWDGLARRGHEVTVAFPKQAGSWFLKARKLYENENLTNLHTLHTGERVFEQILSDKMIEEANDSGAFGNFKVIFEIIEFIISVQTPILDNYLENNHVDVIVHDETVISGQSLCDKYNIPCAAVSVMLNEDTGVMNYWRPPIGMGMHPATPTFLHRLILPLATFASRTLPAILSVNILRKIGQMLNISATDDISKKFNVIFTLCPRYKMKLVTIPPGLDQAQITSPAISFVGPLRDMQRYETLTDHSPELAFLEEAVSEKVPVVFMAAGVTAAIRDEYVVERLAVIRELTKSGHIRILWANKRGLTDDEVASIPGGTKAMMISKYLPQEAVLNHPAVKVFVTHGGSTSMMEGVAAGVPFLCSPYAFEQINNCILLQHRRMGVYVPKDSPIPSFVDGIQTLLDNHAEYSEHVKAVWNRVVVFGEGEDAYGARRGVRLVEGAAQNGIDHLTPEICDWPVYQQLHLDVFGLYVVVGMLFMWMFYLLWKRVKCVTIRVQPYTGKRKDD